MHRPKNVLNSEWFSSFTLFLLNKHLQHFANLIQLKPCRAALIQLCRTLKAFATRWPSYEHIKCTILLLWCTSKCLLLHSTRIMQNQPICESMHVLRVYTHTRAPVILRNLFVRLRPVHLHPDVSYSIVEIIFIRLHILLSFACWRFDAHYCRNRIRRNLVVFNEIIHTKYISKQRQAPPIHIPNIKIKPQKVTLNSNALENNWVIHFMDGYHSSHFDSNWVCYTLCDANCFIFFGNCHGEMKNTWLKWTWGEPKNDSAELLPRKVSLHHDKITQYVRRRSVFWFKCVFSSSKIYHDVWLSQLKIVDSHLGNWWPLESLVCVPDSCSTPSETEKCY